MLKIEPILLFSINIQLVLSHFIFPRVFLVYSNNVGSYETLLTYTPRIKTLTLIFTFLGLKWKMLFLISGNLLYCSEVIALKSLHCDPSRNQPLHAIWSISNSQSEWSSMNTISQAHLQIGS